MPGPQKENGYTPIANELLEAFFRCKLTEYERVLVLCIWRKTYGWRKKEDWISNSQFYSETGIPKPHITRTMKALREKKIVTKDERKVTVNKNYWMWEVDWRVTSSGNKVTSTGNKKLPLQVPTKEKKETIQKQLGETSSPKRNQEDMSWNKQADDYEEGVVDLDGDGTLVEEKKKPTKKYPNAPQVRKAFQEILGRNPANWKVNKNQLIASENLYTERGIQKVRSALKYYQENKEDKFIPRIDSPYDLDAKWTKLGQHKLDHE